MDGLLGSEFKLVLRDSLNNTPRRRRHVPTSAPPPPPPTQAVPSPPTSPALTQPELNTADKPVVSVASLGLRLNLHMNNNNHDTLSEPILPTSPTSPLPTNWLDSLTIHSPLPTNPHSNSFHHATHAPAQKSSPTLSSSSASSSSSSSSFDSPPSFTTTPCTSPQTPVPSQSLPNFHLPTSPTPSSPPIPATHPSPSLTQSLDVLAFVSAEQLNFLPLPSESEQVSSSERSAMKRKAATGSVKSKMNNGGKSKVKKSQVQREQKEQVVKAFKCALCPSTFSQQFNLNKHVRAVHERRRPFQCNVCHARFQQKSHRTMHYLAVHEKLRQFSCDQCPASFSWRGVLKKHRKSIHGIDD